MERRGATEKRSSELIGEMMLAKSVLEEKNELLDLKDRTIRELHSKVRRLELQVEEHRRELCRQSELGECAFVAGCRQVVAEVLRVVAPYDRPEAGPAAVLAGRLVALFCDSYGLDVVEDAPGHIDPEVHQVVEAFKTVGGGRRRVYVMSRGYRLGDRVLQPALVRVSEPSDGARAG